MQIVNLKDYYPDVYTRDCFVLVSDAVAYWMDEYEKVERRYADRTRYHDGYYSLESEEWLHSQRGRLLYEREEEALSLSKREVDLIKKLLDEALSTLTEKQARRLYAHFYLGKSKVDIAADEHVSEAMIRESIAAGLKRMKKFFEKFSEKHPRFSRFFRIWIESQF